jgi:hypothetical protein
MKSPVKVIKPASPVTVIKGWLPLAEQAPLFNALAAGPWHRALIRGRAINRKNIVFYEGDPETAKVYARKATDKEPPIPYTEGPKNCGSFAISYNRSIDSPSQLVISTIMPINRSALVGIMTRKRLGLRFPSECCALVGLACFLSGNTVRARNLKQIGNTKPKVVTL